MTRRPFSLRLALKATTLTLALLPVPLMAAPKIVASLKPVELLVRAVATEKTTVTTLVGPGANPHNFSMKPSQRRALSEADAVFWIGPEMETFLSRLLNGDDFRARSHALMDGGGSEGPGGHAEEHGHGHDHHNHGHSEGPDPHVWLDPAISLEMAREIHSVLAALPEADTAQLNANLEAFEQSLAKTEADINRRLEPARELSLFTYHNAFTHFAEHYDLEIAGVLTLNDELSPGARHIAEVQDKLRKASRPCLMTEQPFNQQGWDTIIGDVEVSFSSWDPLASDIEATSEGYILLQESLAQSVLDCL